MDENSSDMSESSSDETKQTSSASKKRPVPSGSESKRKKKTQQFRQAYCKTWPCISPSSKGDNMAFCKLCRTDFSISHGGANDVMRHCKSERHRQIQEGRKNISINTYFQSTRSAQLENSKLE